MALKGATATVKFTLGELDLIYTEMNASIECGADDPDFQVIREKVSKARAELLVSAEARSAKSRKQ